MSLIIPAIIRYMEQRSSVSSSALKRFVGVAAQRASLRAKVKQTLSFYQITSHLQQVYGVILPPDFRSLVHHFDLFNLSIFALPGLHAQCFGLSSFTLQLLFRATTPLVVIGFAVSICWWRQQLSDVLPVTLWLTFLLFSYVSSPAFQSFACESFDDGHSYLRADFSLICDAAGREQSSYTQLKVLAAVVIVFVPVGVPLLYAALLFTARKRLEGSLRFLTADYADHFFFWELIETSKRLILASFFSLPFFEQGSYLQLVSATLVQYVFLVLQVYAAPFKRASDNHFALMVNVLLSFVFSLCQYLREDELVETTKDVIAHSSYQRFHISAASLTILLSCSTLFVIVATCIIMAYTLVVLSNERRAARTWMVGTLQPRQIHWTTQKTYAAFLSHFKREAASDARYLRDLLMRTTRTPIYLGACRENSNLCLQPA